MSAIGSVGAKLDLNIRQGACFSHDLVFTNPDGTAIDFTGCTAAAMVRKTHADATPAAVFTATITLPNTITLALTAADTAAITAGERPTDKTSLYVWDMEITWADGCITSPLYGVAFIKSQATK